MAELDLRYGAFDFVIGPARTAMRPSPSSNATLAASTVSPDAWAIDTGETRELRVRMVADLVRAGDIVDTRWERVFSQVPRHKFVPRFYRSSDYQEVDGASPESHRSWLETVYSDETLITQRTRSAVTSSGTMPGLIALMLNALDVHDGHRVLQVGTGTGYTAGLLCERLGSDLVTTMDIDPGLTDIARTRLTSTGYHPTVVVGNGADGFPHPPYDRIMATCALTRVPDSWLAQARPGSRIVAPLATGLIALDVHGANDASGRFLPTAGYFMALRPTADTTNPAAEPRSVPTDGVTRPTALTARGTFYQQNLRFLLTVALPEISIGQHGPSLDALLIRDQGDSWARLDPTDDDGGGGGGGTLVTEGGTRQLWTEVEHLHRAWQEWRNPPRERFGLTIADRRQYIWLDDPRGHHTWNVDRL